VICVSIVQVEPGTVIRDPDTGAELTVDESHAVNLANTIYLTPTAYQALKQRIAERPTAS
jgi:hypothetical protein